MFIFHISSDTFFLNLELSPIQHFNMEALTRDLSWSSERLSLAELRERHPSLPAIVKVVHGYCGDTENESLSNEQVG